MGLETTLFEIDPRSALFEMLCSDARYAELLWVLESRYTEGNHRSSLESNDIIGKPCAEIPSMIDAVDEMLESNPELEHGWVRLRKIAPRLLSLLEFAAGRDRANRRLANAVFLGERDFPPGALAGQGMPVRWVDDDRCGEIAVWLDAIMDEEIARAACEGRDRCHGSPSPWSELDPDEREIHCGFLGKLHELFGRVARAEHVVVVFRD